MAASILAVLVPLILGLHKANIQRFKKLTINKVEHEMLIDWMCEQQGKKRGDLPTRHRNGSAVEE